MRNYLVLSYEALAQSSCHQIDSCHANHECSMRERTEREKVEKKTAVLFRGIWKKGMGHFVENLQQRTQQPCHKRTRDYQTQDGPPEVWEGGKKKKKILKEVVGRNKVSYRT